MEETVWLAERWLTHTFTLHTLTMTTIGTTPIGTDGSFTVTTFIATIAIRITNGAETGAIQHAHTNTTAVVRAGSCGTVITSPGWVAYTLALLTHTIATTCQQCIRVGTREREWSGNDRTVGVETFHSIEAGLTHTLSIHTLTLTFSDRTIVTTDGGLTVCALESRIAHAYIIQTFAVSIAAVITHLVTTVDSIPSFGTFTCASLTITFTTSIGLTTITGAHTFETVLTLESWITDADSTWLTCTMSTAGQIRFVAMNGDGGTSSNAAVRSNKSFLTLAYTLFTRTMSTTHDLGRANP